MKTNTLKFIALTALTLSTTSVFANTYEMHKSTPEKQLKALANQNDSDAIMELAYRAENRKAFKEACQLAEKALQLGSAKAEQYIGYEYAENNKCYPKDEEKGAELTRQAAEKGLAGAQANLAWYYEKGIGVRKDEKAAVKWAQKAAEQGSARGQFRLGWAYENGNGVEQSYTKAMEWYKKSADQGNASAQINLGWLYENGKGANKDTGKAFRYYEMSAAKGNKYALNNLGGFYEKGIVVDQDLKKARDYYSQACDKGNERACNNLRWVGRRN